MLYLLIMVLVSECQATFFGPTAVGFGVGLVSLRQRKFPAATSIASKRSSRQYSLSTYYSHTPHASFGYTQRLYTVKDHYWTPRNLAYYQPNIYRYQSTPWRRRFIPGRKKRAAEVAAARRERRQAEQAMNTISIDDVEISKISDIASNVTAGFHDKIWYSDMNVKDRDDCSKRLLCELNAKMADGEPMGEDELSIAEAFGSGDEVDVVEETMDFDIAAIIGKQIGKYMCERRYRRCETPTDIMVQMIRKEIEDMEIVEEEIKSGRSTFEDIDNALEVESEEIEEIKEDDLFMTTTTTTTPAYYPGAGGGD